MSLQKNKVQCKHFKQVNTSKQNNAVRTFGIKIISSIGRSLNQYVFAIKAPKQPEKFHLLLKLCFICCHFLQLSGTWNNFCFCFYMWLNLSTKMMVLNKVAPKCTPRPSQVNHKRLLTMWRVPMPQILQLSPARLELLRGKKRSREIVKVISDLKIWSEEVNSVVETPFDMFWKKILKCKFFDEEYFVNTSKNSECFN